MPKKLGILMLLSAAITLAEIVLIYFSRTMGSLPFKLKIQPDIAL